MKYYEFLYELLTKQYELAKIDEAKDATVIQVLDKAIEPETKTRPKRTLICILAAFVTGILAVIWVLVREVLSNLKSDSRQAEKLLLLKRYLRFSDR